MKTLAAASVLVVCALLAVPVLAATKSVTVGDTFFKARSVTVLKGTTVKWVWRGKLPHDVRVKSGPAKFRSAVKQTGTYSKRFTRSGTYRIFCTIHPNMKMTLTVR